MIKFNGLYRPFIENGSDQLIVTLYTLFIYPSVHIQLFQTIFGGRPVYVKEV